MIYIKIFEITHKNFIILFYTESGLERGEFMYDRVFNRVEEKYLLDKNKYRKLLQILKSKIEKDKYFKTTICNIYFDTFDNELIIESLEKPIYKHKVRLRSYGVPTLEDDVFLEVKFKYKKIVGKRRWRLKLKDFERYLIGKKDIVDNQIMRELDYLFERYHLEPSYFIAYDRKKMKVCGLLSTRIYGVVKVNYN